MIALDVMGGDYAPDEILQGALLAAKKATPLILVGPENLIKSKLSEIDPDWDKYSIKIFDAAECITMDDEPVGSVRKKRNSSIVRVIELVKSGQANVAISAGNSGAMMVAASLILGKDPDLERPAIAGLLPTVGNKQVLALDLGANTDCKPRYLYQFAELGHKYSEKFLGVKNPRIALLSNGQEDSKGSNLTKEAFLMLKGSHLNFVGNIEPHGVYHDMADVIVCDGFSGNILLKAMEASFECFSQIIRERLQLGTDAMLQIEVGIKNVVNMSGGALLLGTKGNVVICHGNSDAHTIEKTLLNYRNFFHTENTL